MSDTDEMNFEELNDNVSYLLQLAWFYEDQDDFKNKSKIKDTNKFCNVNDVLLNLSELLFTYAEENKNIFLENRNDFITLTEEQRKAGNGKESFDIF